MIEVKIRTLIMSFLAVIITTSLLVFVKPGKEMITHNEIQNNNIEELDNSTNLVKHGPRDRKMVTLTFDDGPNPVYTPQILDVLKKHNVKANFFVLGKHAEKYPDIILRMKKEGHEIGNHSYSHINVEKSSIEEIKAEIIKTQEIVKNITGENPKLLRPPYGLYNGKIINMSKEMDLKIVLWTYYQDPKDWSSPGVDHIVEIVTTKIKNGDIILLHDHNEKESHTVEALKTIIPKLTEMGYEFVTISELLNL
ncbi:polysaccharide deacetylase [Gottschalkia purinilytica]|uniref:Polysaccharide deacetylase n=1 Tax=Gottschalkia purinilytica TaxID=1503 RepID=A0A0L0W818_GOTPU|nr:polysaccharide deacetylase family protein [Gottschalkia purinilytica]KNF07586.1 polysaccharide deacetylase [Gottschalkia purinilytica]